MGEVTQILKSMERGEGSAAGELLPLVYDELRRLAAFKLSQEKPGQTLQATALVHEAWLRLASPALEGRSFKGRRHFFSAAAEAMRRILIDRARHKGNQRRGGSLERVELDALEVAAPLPDEQLLALNDALDELVRLDPEAAELVKLRFFVGLSHGDAAEMLGLSRSTADRTWVFARAWLFKRIRMQ
ncbi:MAG TPA: ECF-type sigma factor [Verrucomicrobiae bacterium]